jgi:hypothetical protein
MCESTWERDGVVEISKIEFQCRNKNVNNFFGIYFLDKIVIPLHWNKKCLER